MILPIVIDFGDIVQQFNMNKEQYLDLCDGIAKGLAASYARQLEIEAQNALHQTRKIYIQNIRCIDTGRLEGTVMVDYSKNKLVGMIEEGADPFDIKRGLLRSPKVKIGKNGGRYITVPFRWGTPGAVGESDVFNGRIPDAVYQVVKQQTTTINVPGGGSRSAGLALKDIPKAFQAPQKRAEIKGKDGAVLFKEYEHKTSLYQGMIKQKDGVTGQNTYGSFRRVSENSDPDAFIHPGLERHNLIGAALSKFDQTTETSIGLDRELKRLGFT